MYGTNDEDEGHSYMKPVGASLQSELCVHVTGMSRLGFSLSPHASTAVVAVGERFGADQSSSGRPRQKRPYFDPDASIRAKEKTSGLPPDGADRG